MQGASGAWGLNFAALVVAQVLNIRSSIKVAEDFVSPEHIGRSLELTEQFRALPRGHRRQAPFHTASRRTRTPHAAPGFRRIMPQLNVVPRQEDQLGAKDIMLHAVREPSAQPSAHHASRFTIHHDKQKTQSCARLVWQVSHALSVRGIVDSVDDVLSDGSEAEVED